jgi:hypothetical protein
VRQYARDAEAGLLTYRCEDGASLLLTAGIGIKHRIKQYLVLLVKQDKGFSQRGHTNRIDFMTGRDLTDHGRQIGPYRVYVHIGIFPIPTEIVFRGEIFEDLSSLGKELTLTTGSANVHT